MSINTKTILFTFLITTIMLVSAGISNADAVEYGSPTWQNVVGVSIDINNNLTKTASNSWDNAGASSVESLPSGDGYVTSTIDETNTGRFIGLSNGDGGQSFTDGDFMMYPSANGYIHVYENGVLKGSNEPYQTGDTLKVAVESSVVNYYHNDVLFYTSLTSPVYPLLVDTTLYHTGATLKDIKLGGDNWVIPSDTTSPVITLLGTSPIDVVVGTVYTDAGATAYDNVDGDITSSLIINNQVDTSVTGTYYVYFIVIDSSDNASSLSRTVNVVAPPPVITLLGTSPIDVVVGSLYIDAGATATDYTDGDITANILINNQVDTSVTGTYSVDFAVINSLNVGTSIGRTVNVVDIPFADLLLTINNPTPEDSDSFGWSVAGTSDGNIIVGAINDGDAGSVYLIDGNDGTLLLTINNPTPESGDYFGYSVAATSNGNIIVGARDDNTGAPDAGSAYLFDGTDGTLLLTINNPTPENADNFGRSVAITPNGNIIVGASGDNTGASTAGSVYLFDGTDGSLLLTINNPTPESGDYFGYSVAATSDGNIIVGALYDKIGIIYDAGSAYLFDGTLRGTTSTPLLTINNPTPWIGDTFGVFVAATSDDNIIVGALRDNTGASRTGSAYLFDGTDGTLLLTINNPTPEDNDWFGWSVAGTSDGNILVSAPYDNTGASRAGSAYLFDGTLRGTTSTPLLTINNPTPESSDLFGKSVAGTSDGNILVGASYDNTGASRTGSVYLFDGTN